MKTMLNIYSKINDDKNCHWKNYHCYYYRVLGFVILLLFTIKVPATISVAVQDQHLIDQATAIVIGQVVTIESYLAPKNNKIFTHITLQLDDILKGNIPTSLLTIKLAGGSVEQQQAWIFGTPEFLLDEYVLLFLTENVDGSLRIAHLYQGKFTITVNKISGSELISRQQNPKAVSVINNFGHPKIQSATQSKRLLSDFKTQIHMQLIKSEKNLKSQTRTSVLMPKVPVHALSEFHNAFKFSADSKIQSVLTRWFEPDENLPVTMKVNFQNTPLTAYNTVKAIKKAQQIWNEVEESSFQYQLEGVTQSAGFRQDGINTFSFGDPLGQIDPPIGCSGILAIGGIFSNGSETHNISGQTYYRAAEGDIVFNNGFELCGFFENKEFISTVITHELGHVLGLGHSLKPTSIMYPTLSLGGSPSLSTEDIARLTYIYPNTFANTIPEKTKLITPSGNNNKSLPTFTWKAIEGASWYYLWVNDKSGNRIKTWHKANEARCYTGVCSITIEVELTAGTAQWWVKAWNEKGSGPWSDPFKFTIGHTNLTVSSETMTDDGKLLISWKSISKPSQHDWVGLYIMDEVTQDKAHLAWQYTNGNVVGSMEFALPSELVPGSYELRLFANNGYSRLASSNTFIIDEPKLGISTLHIAVGANIKVSWDNIISPTSQDWMGIYTAGEKIPNTSYLAWQYTSGNSSGKLDFAIPHRLIPGIYELRLFSDNKYTRLVTSNTFTITE